MDAMERRLRLREILAGRKAVMASSVFDPMSARVADELGFEVGLMGGSVASFAVLGAPDVVVLTLPELAEQAKRVCRASKLSVMVDADHGYGNALNVMRTVEELAAAGVAAITIEDTLLPRAFGASGAAQLISVDEGVGKMRAALKACGGTGMLILGRTSAASITGVDDAIARLTAYEQAGVDALFVPQLKSRAELDRIAGAVKLPLIIGGPGDELRDPDYLAARGVRVWMAGHYPFAAAVQAMYETGKALRDGTLPGALKNVASNALMAKLTRAEEYEAAAQEFLTR
jgi:carboxyvinyl-carboxyphosphonate phosphorylmutase